MVFILAITTSLVPVALLRWAWRNTAWYRRALVVSAWLILLAGFWPWAIVSGAEFGSSYHLILLSLSAWLHVASKAERKPPNSKAGAAKSAQRAPQGIAKKTALLLLAGPIAGSASCIVMLTLCQWLPTNQVNQLVVTGISFPLLWAGLAVWICANPRLLYQSTALVLPSLASLGILFS